MSYARRGPDSDVYVFDVEEGTACCWCRLNDGVSFYVKTHAEMVVHLHDHIAAGHLVPDDVIPELEAEP